MNQRVGEAFCFFTSANAQSVVKMNEWHLFIVAYLYIHIKAKLTAQVPTYSRFWHS